MGTDLSSPPSPGDLRFANAITNPKRCSVEIVQSGYEIEVVDVFPNRRFHAVAPVLRVPNVEIIDPTTQRVFPA